MAAEGKFRVDAEYGTDGSQQFVNWRYSPRGLLSPRMTELGECQSPAFKLPKPWGLRERDLMDPIPLAILILAAVVAVQAWLIYQATRSNERNTDRSIERMDRSLEHMDQSTAACDRAADACQSMADAMLMVQEQIMQDRPQPGPAE